MRKDKIWRVHRSNPTLQYIFRHELHISPVLAGLMVNRGISTVVEARHFLEGGLDLMHDPFQMADMEAAAGRISLALDHREKILVYGDYDADGTTATAILLKVLNKLGAQVGHYIPNRMEEGYGLHLEALRRAGRDGYTLVVTVDCGISAGEEVAQNGAENGPDIIITDHHEPPAALPGAVAVINPKRADCYYQFKELAGVGVALKLAQALLSKRGYRADEWLEYLDLACLGTVADIVPLTGENRIIVKYGLAALANTNSTGIKALIEISGIKPESLGTREVGFALAPRLNAAGRIGDAGLAVKLFLTDDPVEAGDLAALLNKGNQERQRIESAVLAEAMGLLDSDPGLSAGRVIVLANEGWHSGVVGIVSSRLVDKYYKPVLMIALEGSQGKGSGRSIAGFHLYNALNHCGGQLVKFGGHEQAAGFTIMSDRVEEFREAINRYARQFIDDSVFVPGMELDAMVSLGEINEDLVREMQLLAPFGCCNPGPVLACRGAELVSHREIGKNGGHLKLMIREKGAVFDGIAFKQASCAPEIAAAAEVDVAFLPAFNEWKGRRSIQLEVKDIRPAGEAWEIYGPEDTGSGAQEYNSKQELETVNSLERMGPLAYVPEFLSTTINSFKEVSGNFLYPEEYLYSFPKGFSDWENFGGGKPPIISEREMRLEYKPLTLLSVINRLGGNTVLVNSPGRAVEIAAYLNRSGVSAAYMHSGALPGEAGAVREAFSSGAVRAVVCTYETLDSLDIRPESAVLFVVPFSPVGLGGAAGWSSVHSLLGEKDIAVGFEYMESLAPSRDRLADLYTYLASLKGSKYLDPENAACFIRDRGLTRAGLHTVAFGLSVFSDLGLVKCRRQGEGYLVEIMPVSGKKDVNSSQIYLAGQEIKLTVEKWWKDMRNVS
ncbi:MAG: single-stranded-DNA-specific exonuclease RecJ [Desulfocucumaceae bacterium]